MSKNTKPLRDLLRDADRYLQRHGVEDARTVAELLVARVCKLPRLHLHTVLDCALPEAAVEALRRGLVRVAKHEPVQYVLGEWDFRNITLCVDARALIPRPETELLVDWVLETQPLWQLPTPRVADIGTGTGCIILSIAAERSGADVIFAPAVSEMYGKGFRTFVEPRGELTAGLCGASRPGHFAGVATVVLKLFNIVKPDNAYFGQKDAQQLAVIRNMVCDLDLEVNIIPCPIIREPNGLAKSSRNSYLTKEEAEQAPAVYRALSAAANAGAAPADEVKDIVREIITRNAPLAEIEYIEAVDPSTMTPVEIVRDGTLLAAAVRFPSARLIDNVECRM